MSKHKVNKVKLNELLRKGWSQNRIAEYFKCSPGAVSMAKKKLSIAVVKNIQLENAGLVVSKNLKIIDQLTKMERKTNELLDFYARCIEGDKEALEALERQTQNKRIKYNDPAELALRAISELRNQQKLKLDILNSLYNWDEVAKFQDAVLDAISKASPETRKLIIEELNAISAIRKSLNVN